MKKYKQLNYEERIAKTIGCNLKEKNTILYKQLQFIKNNGCKWTWKNVERRSKTKIFKRVKVCCVLLKILIFHNVFDRFIILDIFK